MLFFSIGFVDRSDTPVVPCCLHSVGNKAGRSRLRSRDRLMAGGRKHLCVLPKKNDNC